MKTNTSKSTKNQPNHVVRFCALYATALLSLALSTPSLAALNENCIVSVLNRTVQVKPDGTWVLPNIPANSGPVRARATCVENGLTTSGQSDLFTVPVNGSLDVPPIVIGPVTPVPTNVYFATGVTLLNQPGQTAQLQVMSRYADDSIVDTTAAATGTQYLVSNPALVSISPDGLVTALASGTVIVQAINEGTQGLLKMDVILSADSDGDGIPDDVELANGLDPNNPADALDDVDHDGLNSLNEYLTGTDMRNPDTDGDTIMDGEEVIAGLDGVFTNPLLADTDGDGIPDNIEIVSGSDPNDANSTNLAAVLQAITVTPANAIINVNSVIGLGFTQLVVTGEFIQGGTIDLTSIASGTNYNSSDLLVCNFGAEAGRVYGGSNGPCTITISNSGFTATSQINVNFFVPTALSFVAIPGYANNVDVAGDYAYVAAGTAGLQIVDVTDRSNPTIVGALDTAGNAKDVRVVGNLAYVADGIGGLQIIDITVPTAPALRGTYNTTGNAKDVVVVGNRAYVADGTSGLQIIDITNPAVPVLLGTFNSPNTAKGVDISGNLAVLADASSVIIVDVSNPALPVSLGSIATSDARDITVDGNFAYVADYTGSLKIIDFSSPGFPTLAANTAQSLGGILNDVTKAGRFVFGADVFFVNGVPITDVTDPNNPLSRARLDFPVRDDNGTGIAVDGQYIYLTAAASGTDTRLYIGQYLIAEDKAGIAPIVSIVSPQDGATVIEGAKLHVTVNATDDTQVVAVDLLVDGQIVATDTSAPYQFNYAVPVGSTSFTLDATAIDLGGNIGNASQVSVSVMPDPLTTVIGQVIDSNGQPVSEATLTVFDNLSVTSDALGAFSIADVQTVLGGISVSAIYTPVTGSALRGYSTSFAPVSGAVTDVGQIQIRACAVIPAGIVNWWPGEGDAKDAFGVHDGTLFNGTAFTAGKVGQAFSFEGVDDAVINALNYQSIIADSFTMEFWAMPLATRGTTAESITGTIGVASGQRYVIFPRHGGLSGVYAGAGVSLGTNGISVFEHAGSYMPSTLVYNAPINGWTHIAVIYINNQPNLYINGVHVKTGLITGRTVNPSSSFGQVGNVNGTLYGPYSGLLDEVAIYSRALTGAEIQSIYQADNAGKCVP